MMQPLLQEVEGEAKLETTYTSHRLDGPQHATSSQDVERYVKTLPDPS